MVVTVGIALLFISSAASREPLPLDAFTVSCISFCFQLSVSSPSISARSRPIAEISQQTPPLVSATWLAARVPGFELGQRYC